MSFSFQCQVLLMLSWALCWFWIFSVQMIKLRVLIVLIEPIVIGTEWWHGILELWLWQIYQKRQGSPPLCKSALFRCATWASHLGFFLTGQQIIKWTSGGKQLPSCGAQIRSEIHVSLWAACRVNSTVVYVIGANRTKKKKKLSKWQESSNENKLDIITISWMWKEIASDLR